MRLLSLALGIVIAFGLGVWGISKVVPTTAPQWVGVGLSMTYLFLLVFLAAAQTGRRSRKVRDQRRLLEYGVLVAVLMASLMLVLFVEHLQMPRWLIEAAFFVTALALFLLYRYMTARKFRSILK
jgi:hypothetical protein